MRTYKLHVSELTPDVTNVELRALFEQHGHVLECEVIDHKYAFVHYDQREAAEEALRELNGHSFKGRKLRVSHARNQKPPKTKIFVGGLRQTFQESEIRELFEKYGAVKEVAILKGYAFVFMEKSEDSEKAVRELNRYRLKDCTLRVELSTGERSGARDGDRPNPYGPMPPLHPLDYPRDDRYIPNSYVSGSRYHDDRRYENVRRDDMHHRVERRDGRYLQEEGRSPWAAGAADRLGAWGNGAVEQREPWGAERRNAWVSRDAERRDAWGSRTAERRDAWDRDAERRRDVWDSRTAERRDAWDNVAAERRDAWNRESRPLEDLTYRRGPENVPAMRPSSTYVDRNHRRNPPAYRPY